MKGAKTAVEITAMKLASNPVSSEFASVAVKMVIGMLMITPQAKKKANSVLFGL